MVAMWVTKSWAKRAFRRFWGVEERKAQFSLEKQTVDIRREAMVFELSGK
jgi:hypothetical protein